MALLEYDFRVVNANVVEKALAGIERRVVVHNQRVAKTLGQTAHTSPGRTMATARAINPEVVAVEKVAQAKIKAEAKVDAFIRRADAKRASDREKAAEREALARLKAEARADTGIRKAEAKRIRDLAKAQQAAQVRTGRAVGRSVSNAIGGVGKLAGAALSIGGGFAVAGAIESQMSEQAQASKLANQAGTPGDKKQILADARSVQGFTGEQAMRGMSEFVSLTGDLKSARDLLKDLGAVSLATDSDIGDMGATAGEVFNALKDQITDPVERLKQVKDIVRTFAAQGAMGAVEIKDMAKQSGKLGAASHQFEGGTPGLLKMAGAFAQTAKDAGGAVNAEDAATAVARLAGDMVTNRKKFQALGVGIVGKKDKTKLRDPMEILADLLDKTGGDVTKTGGLFGLESKKIFQGFSSKYSEAEKKQKGSGKAAIMDKYGSYAGATLTDAEIKQRNESRMGDADMQFQEAMKQFNIEVGTHLLPAVQKMIPKFVELIPVVTKLSEGAANLAEYLMTNPMRGVMLAMTASVAKDVAAASLGKVLSESLSTQLGKAGGVIAVAAGAFTVGSAIIDLGFDAIDAANKKNVRQSAENFNAMTGARGELAHGGLSDARKKELQAIVDQGNAAAGSAPTDRQEFLRTFLAGFTNNTISGGITGGGVTGGLASVASQAVNSFIGNGGPSVTGAITQSEREAGRAEQIRAATEANALLKQAVTSLEKISGNTSATAPNRGNKPSPVKP